MPGPSPSFGLHDDIASTLDAQDDAQPCELFPPDEGDFRLLAPAAAVGELDRNEDAE